MTPSPAVVVEMSASDASTPYAQVLVEACSDGLRREGPCALEGSATSDSARAVAIVSWEGVGRSSAKIEVGVRRAAHADWLTRRVTFDASDAEVERWRAVGLIIATLVGGEAAREPTPSTERPAPPPPAMPAPAASMAPSTPAGPSWFFEVGADLARGAGDGLGAFGPTGRIGAALRSTPLFLTASLRYEIEPLPAAQVRLEWGWLSMGFGVATPLGRTPLVLEARFELELGGIRASALGGGPAQSGGLFGAREGVGLTWWWARWIGLALCVDALETTRSAVVNVSNGAGATPVARAQWLGWSTGLGLRFRTD